MSIDYKQYTYRPELFQDTNKRTSYSKMHTWMTLKPKDQVYQPPQVSPHPHLTPDHAKPISRQKRRHLDKLVVPKLEDYYKGPVNYLPVLTSSIESNIPMMHFGYDGVYSADQGNRARRRVRRYLPTLVYKSFEDQIGKVDVPLFAGALPPVHMQYYKSGGYDDFHKAALKQSRNDQATSQAFPSTFEPTAIRNGQCGSNWRHVKEVQPAKSTTKQVYIDGQIGTDDKARQRDKMASPPRARDSIAPSPRPAHRRSPRNSGLPHDPNFTPRLIVLDQEEKIEKLEFEDREAQKGVEYNNWNLLR